MAGYLANMLGDANNLGFFATPEALEAAYPVGAPGYFAIVGSTNTLWVWDEITEAWVDSGAPGADAYVYIAYASDSIGTDFTNTFDPNLDYIAIKNTTVQIPAPVAADFAGLWKKYKGEPGKGIASVVKTATVGLVDTYTITFTDTTTFDYDVTNGQDGIDGTDGTAFIWKGTYSAITTYQANDTVSYNGSSYICILESTGNLPTDTTYWALIAQKGIDGEGAGDMLASVYDPTSVAGDAFDMDNMVEGTNNKLVSSAEKTAWNNKLDDITGESIADLSDVDSIAGITDGKVLKWDTDKFVVADDNDTTYDASDFDIKDLTDSTNLMTTWSGKQDALGFTPENVANKSTNVSTDGASDTKYPSVKAIKDYADGLVVGLWDDRGSYDASVNTYPAAGGSGTAGAILKGDIWTISVAGTLGGVAVAIGDTVRALTDTPGQTSTNWSILENNIGYVPENVANKVTSFQATPDDSHYPSEKLVKDSLDAKAPLAYPTFTGTVTLADNARIDLTLPTVDTYVTGNTTDSFASGYSSSVGDLVFFGSGGKWLEVDADAVATCKGLIGIALEAKNDTEIMKVALPGSFVRLDSWNWTVGATLYAGETLGAMQETIPTGADAVIKVVGFAVSSDVIYFNPSPDQQSTVA